MNFQFILIKIYLYSITKTIVAIQKLQRSCDEASFIDQVKRSEINDAKMVHCCFKI